MAERLATDKNKVYANTIIGTAHDLGQLVILAGIITNETCLTTD